MAGQFARRVAGVAKIGNRKRGGRRTDVTADVHVVVCDAVCDAVCLCVWWRHANVRRLAQANADNMDVTGKAGATLYAAATDPHAPLSAWLRGSIPNYRAESQYILSGVFGNYEKSLENMPTMAVVSGKLPARTVAYTIIDEAYKDKTSPDCTGSVDKDGVHGVGKGTPPCTALLKFNKPKGERCLMFAHCVCLARVTISGERGKRGMTVGGLVLIIVMLVAVDVAAEVEAEAEAGEAEAEAAAEGEGEGEAEGEEAEAEAPPPAEGA